MPSTYAIARQGSPVSVSRNQAGARGTRGRLSALLRIRLIATRQRVQQQRKRLCVKFGRDFLQPRKKIDA